jgi:hypothetical protein
MADLTPEPACAPCVVVVGPANSGKTTFLHLLDQALQQHPDLPLVYIVKGTPDGTGRYLFHAPDLREVLKPEVKGRWSATTPATVSQWIAHCRAALDLVIVDFGGRYGAHDDAMLGGCTHFIALAREMTPAEDAAEGLDFWSEVCLKNGLLPVARLRSFWQRGRPSVSRAADGTLTGSFRADASRPEDSLNAALIEQVVTELMALRLRRPSPTYVNLQLARRWTLDDLGDLGGQAETLDAMVARGEPVVLGGRAPIWAYAAALHRVLARDPDAKVMVFDPKIEGGLVEIPPDLHPPEPSPWLGVFTSEWDTQDGEARLKLVTLTEDKQLPPDLWRFLANAPSPRLQAPDTTVCVYGVAPVWLHLAYSRWLRRNLPGCTLGHWDASTRRTIVV